ncbi:Hypp4468 [Branchiostoma lanceolatum]|uniref:Hypp4468 protein n=1 Tax=Branchiostoma lanceolatum TaxID=7740 RepID=A0A8K0AAJ2_BRALA|nr:Hypp4468 [Branchiostoma lanceolatum]
MDFYWYIILFVAIILKILFYLCWFYSRQRRLAGAGPNELTHGTNPDGTLSRPPPYPGIDGENPPASPVGSFPEPPPYCELDEHDGKPPPYHAVVALKEAQAIQAHNAPPHSHNAPPQGLQAHYAPPQAIQSHNALPLAIQSHNALPQMSYTAQVSQHPPPDAAPGGQEPQVSQDAPVQAVTMTTGVIDNNTSC